MSTHRVDLTNPVSPKTIAATLVALIVPAVSAALLYLQTDQGAQLYAALPVWLIVFVRALVTGLATWIVAYQVADPNRILDLAASPKVVAATLAAVVVQAVIDLIAFLLGPEGTSLYAAWNPIVVIAIRPTVETGVRHERVGTPLRWTVHAPHWPMPHAYFVPTRSR